MIQYRPAKFKMTRLDVYNDVLNWALTPEELLANTNPDELARELPELLADRKVDDWPGVELEKIVTWYMAAAAVRALKMCDESTWDELSKIIPRNMLYDCWDMCFSIYGKGDALTLYLDELDEWEGE